MEKIVFYTTHCPKCEILQEKLDAKKVKYEIFDDKEKMIELGMRSIPVLEVDGKKMQYLEAVKWVNAK